MEQALARFPTLSLDPKRIVGTSVAIAVHLAVLMVLMMPSQRAEPTAAVDDHDLIVVPMEKIEKTEPIEKIKIQVKTPPKTQETRVEIPPDVNPTADSSPIDYHVPVEDPKPPTDFGSVDPQPSFAQIVAVSAPTPPYPLQALQRRMTGTVTLRIVVDAQGQPVDVVVESSSGSKLLDEAARKFVKARWRFRPATQDGKPVQAEALVPVEFVLPG